ncbi:MAG: ABC transporter ATP-binding protein [Candidatus Tectomicrobia bacterium]|uniref:ABC transporter ATP-binding protein n=1 Tax=Tectimicrobiota bacterium TaxID=2528274 RepID=A0A932GMK2_UNCTE|nr:ABC transporter ATP-binding protein [Candidatus Tectomicrobia bacterium]
MIEIQGVRKSYATEYGPVEAVRGLDLQVRKGEFCVLLGPSGCGKTTTLRCVAGLERPDSGRIVIGDRVVNSSASGVFVPVEKRDIGMVFQSYAVWPHMSVFRNVAFPLTDGWRRVPRAEVVKRVSRALERVHLEGLENRPSTTLSGGQQQRVALARAIVTEPGVLLMDEPLSNLDARLREEMRGEIRRLTQNLGMTTLYVTHDQSEALEMGDMICVMNQGEILQTGTAEEIYQKPASRFVAEFVGKMNFIKGRVAAGGVVESPLGGIRCPVPPGLREGQEVILAIRPEHLELRKDGDGFGGEGNAVQGELTAYWYQGDTAFWEVRAGETNLVAKVSADLRAGIGARVKLGLPAERLRVFADSPG